jgi:hypothetical protein
MQIYKYAHLSNFHAYFIRTSQIYYARTLSMPCIIDN